MRPLEHRRCACRLGEDWRARSGARANMPQCTSHGDASARIVETTCGRHVVHAFTLEWMELVLGRRLWILCALFRKADRNAPSMLERQHERGGKGVDGRAGTHDDPSAPAAGRCRRQRPRGDPWGTAQQQQPCELWRLSYGGR